LVMLLPDGASPRTQYYCRMMGRIVLSSACDNEAAAKACDNEAAAKAANPAQQFQRADCCDRLTSSSRNASLGTLDAVPDVPHAASVAAPEPLLVGLLRDSGRVCAESTQAPLTIGPPLFIAYCAFLS